MAELWMPGATREPQAGGVTLNTNLPPRATWHITWDAVTNGAQPPMANVSNYLKNAGYCPHLMWNPFTGEIIQYYPANVGGRALNAWNEDGAVNIQIEVYFSPSVVNSGRTYQTVAETPAKGWDKLLTWLDSHGIPRVWPMGAPQWQGNPRNVDIWNTKAGHYGHCNVPNNTHTDPGPMPTLGKAGTITTKPLGTNKPTPIQEDDMSEKDVKEIVSQVKEHVNALLIGVYDSAGKKNLPGLRPVLVNTQGRVTAIGGKVDALTELVKQLAKAQGVTIDYAKVEAAAAAGVAKAIADSVELETTVTIKAGDK